MQEPLEDALFLWMVHHAPLWLHDEDLFDSLLRFIHLLLQKTRQEERRSLTARMLRTSLQ